MAAPRLRTKLAAASMPEDEDEKAKGKKADGTPVDENETEEERKKREEEEKEAAAKAQRSAAADPVAADRARTKAITSSAHAKHFPALASHLAYDLAVSAEAVFAAVLQDVDVTAAAAATPPAGAKGDAFRRAMAAEAPNPALGTAAGGAVGGTERLMSVHEVRAAKAAAKNK